MLGESASLSWNSTDVLRASPSNTRVAPPGCDCVTSPETPGGAMIVNETGCMGTLLVAVAIVWLAEQQGMGSEAVGTTTGAANTCCRLPAAMSVVGLDRPTASWACIEFLLAIMAAVAPFNCSPPRLSPFLPITTMTQVLTTTCRLIGSPF